eukprot:jgi/Chlat1/6752/Chrsp50S06445
MRVAAALLFLLVQLLTAGEKNCEALRVPRTSGLGQSAATAVISGRLFCDMCNSGILVPISRGESSQSTITNADGTFSFPNVYMIDQYVERVKNTSVLPYYDDYDVIVDFPVYCDVYVPASAPCTAAAIAYPISNNVTCTNRQGRYSYDSASGLASVNDPQDASTYALGNFCLAPAQTPVPPTVEAIGSSYDGYAGNLQVVGENLNFLGRNCSTRAVGVFSKPAAWHPDRYQRSSRFAQPVLINSNYTYYNTFAVNVDGETACSGECKGARCIVQASHGSLVVMQIAERSTCTLRVDIRLEMASRMSRILPYRLPPGPRRSSWMCMKITSTQAKEAQDMDGMRCTAFLSIPQRILRMQKGGKRALGERKCGHPRRGTGWGC